MAQWFETSVTYDKMMENGTIRKSTEKFLFDALSFTEAEARTIEERTPFVSGDFSVKTAKRTKISEIFFNPAADRWYLVNVAFITIDEKTVVEKRTISQILVQANDFDSAVSAFKDRMKGTMADYEVVSVTETPYMGVYPVKLNQ